MFTDAISSELEIPDSLGDCLRRGMSSGSSPGSIEPEHLATVREVQIDMAQRLARFEDGPAVLFTAGSTRRHWRHMEQMASNLICLSEQRATSYASGAERGGS